MDQSAATSNVERREAEQQSRFRLGSRSWRLDVSWMYIIAALPTAILLCGLTPPMQSPDEGRHFLRACQLVSGRFVSEIQPATRQAGGWLPAAASDFVKDKMTSEYLRREDQLRTIGARLAALDEEARAQRPLDERKFAEFPSATIYPPSLYLPQCAGIMLARAFSPKIYLWFYSARLFNATAAIIVIFWALRLAPQYQILLVIPAMLPMSLYQISSISSDAAATALSVLFVALCARFIDRDSFFIRLGLITSMLLLVTGKPVYLPLGLLILASYRRLGWPRAVAFCSLTMAISAVCYGAWSKLVRPFVAVTGQGGNFAGFDPAAQLHTLIAHPAFFAMAVQRTLEHESQTIFLEMVGRFGWFDLSLPRWMYAMWLALLCGVAFTIWANRKRTQFSKLLFGALAVGGTLCGIFLAAFILWTPVGSVSVQGVQGRYLIPALPAMIFFVPPAYQMGARSRSALFLLVGGVLTVSTFETIRILERCYFPEPGLVGRNIHELVRSDNRHPCPADVAWTYVVWFSTIAKGRAQVPQTFIVVITDDDGSIVGESDPVLENGDLSRLFPHDWLLHMWNLNHPATLRYWLITGETGCTFGPPVNFEPRDIPAA